MSIVEWADGAGGRRLGGPVRVDSFPVVPGRRQKNRLVSYADLVLSLDRGDVLHRRVIEDRYRIHWRTRQRWLADIERFAFPLERRADGTVRKAVTR